MDECPPLCSCKANINRRDFLKIGATLAGAVTGGTGGSAAAAQPGFIPPEARIAPAREWFEKLYQAGEPIVYRGEHLRQVIFPIGGIGTGTMWLNGAGKLVNWQIFNNIQKDSLADDTFFAVRIEQEGKPPLLRVLQAQDVGPAKAIPDISLLGRYPVATLSFTDKTLPVDLELEAFNPLVPLDEKNSGLPCAIFTVRAKNWTQRPLKISVLGTLQNAVNHAGQGAANGHRHLTYGGNINQVLAENAFTAVAMKAEPGRPARMDPPVELLTDHRNLPLLTDSPVEGLSLATAGAAKANASVMGVYWLANGDLKLLGGSVLDLIAEDVNRYGAFLLLSGASNPLMEGVAPTVVGDVPRRETVFASFDADNYGVWNAEGNAFGRGPSKGTELNQNPVGGFTGPGLINTYQGTDVPQGRLTSPTFTIRERYVSFLIGGGQYPGKCCLNLTIDGKVARTETGQNTEQLRRVEWDVNDLVGKDARFEILDLHSEGWGHVLVDDIRLSNLPIDAVTARDAERWNTMVRRAAGADPMTAVGVGEGRIMRAPVELGTPRPGVDPIRQRDNVLSLIAKLANVDYRPAVGRPENAPSFGTMCLATPGPAAACSGWTSPEELLGRFAENGALPASTEITQASPPGETWNAALARQIELGPEQTAEVAFVIAWHFPSQYYPQQSYREGKNQAAFVGNMYANWFADAAAVVRDVVTELPQLRSRTHAFRDAMFDTSLPQYFADAVAANVSILRSPTCFWTKAGTFYGFEGCNPQGGGCCPMNCNHVWNYEQTLAKLWPALERNMRDTELKYHQRPDGGLKHRVSVPRDNPDKPHIPVADGQCGAVLKAYREHLQSDSRRFLDDHWAEIKKAMDFAVSNWDKDADGIMDQPQFNTYDRVIFGKNTFVSSLYLAALRAAEEMARLSRDENAARRYRELFEKGRAHAAEKLFNGEYYIQIDENLTGGYGTGCCADQVVGQWWARILQLGDILPVEQVRSALSAVFRHNWLWTQEGFAGTQRFQQFADGKDKGLLICSWPKGGRPADPILYRDEAWTGVEYQVAAHKIYEGQIEEALAIVQGVRERYDGVKRSPWNEIECGDYYARALSSWSLLLAAQGYFHDGPARSLSFNPVLSPEEHRSFFSTAAGWGRFTQRREQGRQRNTLTVDGGRCDLAELRLGLPAVEANVAGKLNVGDREIVAKVERVDGHARITFNGPITVPVGETLSVELTYGT